MNKLFQQIEDLDHEQFEELLNFIDRIKKKRARAVVNEARNEARRIAKKYGVELDELMGVPSTKRAKRPMKYQNPDNPEQQWNGFGRKPDWLKAKIAAGVDEQDLLTKTK